jgi:HPt (histidine-containing phosphotransfer) domain-containing protein
MEDYLHFIDIFYMDGKKKIKLIDNLAKENAYNDYKIHVHGLKSAAANIGAFYLSDMAKKLEAAAADKDEAYIKENHQKLMKVYAQLLKDIERVLKKKEYGSFEPKKVKESDAVNEAAGKSDDKADNTDYKILREKVAAALKSVEHFKPKDAIAALEKMLEGELPELYEEQIKEVLNLLKVYEDDIAEDKLRKMLEMLEDEKVKSV